MVFFAGAFFDAAADVKAVNAKLNCLNNVIGINSAGEENPLADIAYDVPVESQAGTAVFFRIERIEKNRVGKEIIGPFYVLLLFDAYGLYRFDVI